MSIFSYRVPSVVAIPLIVGIPLALLWHAVSSVIRWADVRCESVAKVVQRGAEDPDRLAGSLSDFVMVIRRSPALADPVVARRLWKYSLSCLELGREALMALDLFGGPSSGRTILTRLGEAVGLGARIECAPGWRAFPTQS